MGAARETAAAAGVEREIAFLPCDGLEAVSPDDADTVIIAGMGGETIAGILARSPWTREKHLILQPMTRAGMLRKWLYANGYIISRENLVRESGEIYEVITATGGREDPPPEAELYTGKYELASQNELFDVFLDRLLARMEKAAKGLEKSGKPEDQGRLREAKIVLEGLYKMKGEKEHA